MPFFPLLYKHLSNYTHPRMDVFIQMLKYLTWQVCKYLWAAKHQRMLALCCTSWQALLVWVKLLANAGRLLHPKWQGCRVLLWNTQIHQRGSAQAACALENAPCLCMAFSKTLLSLFCLLLQITWGRRHKSDLRKCFILDRNLAK